MYLKRVLACLLGGVLAAVICVIGGQIIFGFAGVDAAILASSIANRILIGFVIGISGWKIQYLLHGAMLGFIISITVSIGFIGSNNLGFVLYTTAGILYGVMIELLSTKIFKAPMK
ncbi:MAG: hypothetical protein ISS19_16315 [Bacteroidales bacterium]|nr:hypothetical protein [Bacteroidales bacterium]